MRFAGILGVAALLFAAEAGAAELRVGSKAFTESVILGDMIALLARDAGATVRHRRELGGTRVLWEALKKGEIDVYPEYTGTLKQEILSDRKIASDEALRRELEGIGLGMSRPIGFNNTYAVAMKPEFAERHGIRAISDLARHPEIRLGFSSEFMDRADGWPALKRTYALPHTNVKGLDHDLAYRGLDTGSIDAIDVYSTDAEISYYGLTVLADDRRHFPAYDAVILYRAALGQEAPDAVAAILRLEGAIGAQEMARLNAEVKLEGKTDSAAAAGFLARTLGVDAETHDASMVDRLVVSTLEHLTLVAISLGAAILISVPLGIVAAYARRAGQVILGVVGILQVIPSLALFVFMIPLLGIGGPPAVVALFLYSLLPIVRNTYTGLHDISPSVRESAAALGLPFAARLRLIELPIAARSILAGIKTSAVINIGTATLGALIGAGGYGQPILTGIRLDDIGLILEGAVPAALLALTVQGLFEIAERAVVAKGLRLGSPG